MSAPVIDQDRKRIWQVLIVIWSLLIIFQVVRWIVVGRSEGDVANFALYTGSFFLALSHLHLRWRTAWTVLSCAIIGFALISLILTLL